jgi:hypothetical protein
MELILLQQFRQLQFGYGTLALAVTVCLAVVYKVLVFQVCLFKADLDSFLHELTYHTSAASLRYLARFPSPGTLRSLETTMQLFVKSGGASMAIRSSRSD